MLAQQAALLRGERALWRIWFFEKFFWNFSFCQGLGHAQAQPGFQAQPSMQQVEAEIFRGYSTFWPENHLTWQIWPQKWIFEVRFTLWSGFQTEKLNIRRELELDHAQNRAEPENQAGLVRGPDPDKMKIFKNFFQKTKPATLLVQHVKGQPAASTYVREKGGVTFDTIHVTPCILNYIKKVEQGPQGATGTSGDWYGSQRGGHVSNQDAAGPISKSPMPEYWCSIAYFELDTQVGNSSFSLGYPKGETVLLKIIQCKILRVNTFLIFFGEFI